MVFIKCYMALCFVRFQEVRGLPPVNTMPAILLSPMQNAVIKIDGSCSEVFFFLPSFNLLFMKVGSRVFKNYHEKERKFELE